MKSLSDRERAIRQRLKDDFLHYAAKCLRIRTKAGKIEPLALNAAQLRIHDCLERQLRETGKVRAIILKGRQQGCSTYVEARFYWRVTHRRGVRAFILTHHDDATSNLFEMASRYHEHCPALVKPQTGSANAKELLFAKLDSGYKVGTAGTKAVGRSSTIQFFHGSEAAYWPFADTHAAGVMQAVPDEPGTEVILESTANSPGDWFHRQWQAAVAGQGEFQAIFVPWYIQPEYRKEVPAGFQRTGDEAEYADIHGLDDAQLVWRRAKIVELGGGDIGATAFKREYPATPEEAFEVVSENAVIPASVIRSAVDRDVAPTGPRIVWGLDVARMGDDRCALAKRRGNTLLEPVQWWEKHDTMQTAGRVYGVFHETPFHERPDVILVDVIGLGAGVVDRLIEMGLPAQGVNVAESPSVKERYNRLRDELWFKARGWFEGRDVVIPDDQALIAELCAVSYAYASNGRLKVEGKDELATRGIRSPDLADAFVLTFATSDFRGGYESSYEPPAYED